MNHDYIDISIPVTGDMLVYPGDPAPQFRVASGAASGDGWNVGSFEGGLHIGTHADAPWHRLNDGKKLHEVDLSAFIGPCFVADLGDLDGRVTAEALERLALPRQIERLLLKTRNSRSEYWREPWKPDAAALDCSAAAWCVERRLKLVGIDYLSIEQTGGGEVHSELLGHDIVILEGLWLQHGPSGWYELVAAPVKLIGTDGAWCRALLRRI